MYGFSCKSDGGKKESHEEHSNHGGAIAAKRKIVGGEAHRRSASDDVLEAFEGVTMILFGRRSRFKRSISVNQSSRISLIMHLQSIYIINQPDIFKIILHFSLSLSLSLSS